MKKLFAKITSLAIAVVISLFCFSGCQLITTNAERDMDQVIAVVAVDEALSQDIKKRELVSLYNSQGYYYVQYQGMSQKETYELLLENLVKNKIIVQQAKLALTGDGYFKKACEVTENKTSTEQILSVVATFDENGNLTGEGASTSVVKTDSAEKFLTKYEYLQARYSVLSYARQLIDGYKDEEDEHEHKEHESFSGTARATISIDDEESYDEYEMKYDDAGKVLDEQSDFYKTLAKINKDADLGVNFADYQTKYDLSVKIYEEFEKQFIDLSKDRVAINKLIKELKSLGFITDAEAKKKTPSTAKEILELTFFKDTLVSQYEDVIISKYQNALINTEEKNLAKDLALYEAYKNVYDTQKAKYENDYTVYETALENASDESLVLYNPKASEGKYGYVLNLLIGFSDEQKAILDSLEENDKLSKTEKENARKNLLKTLTARDLRDSWVESNYGSYNAETGVFTFDNKYLKSGKLNTYQGTIYGAEEYVYHDDYDEEQTAYSYKSVKGSEVGFNAFYENVVKTLMGFTGNEGKIANYSKDHENLFKDLIFAYSTDGGSLQDNYGYLYSPKTSKDKYVEEFAICAEKLVNNVNYGVGSYAVVSTEYGYHILLCTKVVEPSNDETFISFDDFKAQVEVEGSLPYLFKEYQKDAIVSDNVSKKTDAIFNSSLSSSVKYFEDRYEDLLKA